MGNVEVSINDVFKKGSLLKRKRRDKTWRHLLLEKSLKLRREKRKALLMKLLHMFEKFYEKQNFKKLYNELSKEKLYTLYKRIDFKEYWKV